MASIVVALPLLAGEVAAHQSKNAADQDAMAQFSRGVEQYLEARRAAVAETGRLHVTTDPETLTTTASALADAIGKARGLVGEGEIFRPEAAALFRSRIQDVLRGPAGARVRTAIAAVQPSGWIPSVGAVYPARQPVSSMPPELLSTLPTLPAELEYRFVGADLLLLDRNTGLIVDMLGNALPRPSQ